MSINTGCGFLTDNYRGAIASIIASVYAKDGDYKDAANVLLGDLRLKFKDDLSGLGNNPGIVANNLNEIISTAFKVGEVFMGNNALDMDRFKGVINALGEQVNQLVSNNYEHDTDFPALSWEIDAGYQFDMKLVEDVKEKLLPGFGKLSNNTDVTNLIFKGDNMLQSEFSAFIGNKIRLSAIINPSAINPSIPRNDLELDLEIKNLKEKLFKSIFGDDAEYFESGAVEIQRPSVERILKAEFDKFKDIEGTELARMKFTNPSAYERYINLMTLVHFDEMLKVYGHGIVSVNENAALIPDNRTDIHPKYTFAKHGHMRASWSDDSMTESHTLPNAVKTTLEGIQLIDDTGRSIPMRFLKLDNVYDLIGRLARKNYKEDGSGVTSRSQYMENIKSLMLNVLRSHYDRFYEMPNNMSLQSFNLTVADMTALRALYSSMFFQESDFEDATNGSTWYQFGQNILSNHKENGTVSFYEAEKTLQRKGNFNSATLAITSFFDGFSKRTYTEFGYDPETKMMGARTADEVKGNKAKRTLFNMYDNSLSTTTPGMVSETFDKYGVRFKRNDDVLSGEYEIRLPSGMTIAGNTLASKSIKLFNADGVEIPLSEILSPKDVITTQDLESDEFSDYATLLKLYRAITEHSDILSGNLNTLNTFKKVYESNTDKSHVEGIIELISGNAFAKSVFYEGMASQENLDLMKMTPSEKSSYFRSHGTSAEDVVDPVDKYGNVNLSSFNSTMKNAFIKLTDAYAMTTGELSKAVTVSPDGKAFANNGNDNLIHNIEQVVTNLHKKRNKLIMSEGGVYDSIPMPLEKNPFFINPKLLKAVATRGAYDVEGVIKYQSSMSVYEALFGDLIIDYGLRKYSKKSIETGVQNPLIQFATMADKNTQPGMIIDGEQTVTFADSFGDEVEMQYKEMSANDFIQAHYSTTRSYFRNLNNRLVKLYTEMFTGQNVDASGIINKESLFKNMAGFGHISNFNDAISNGGASFDLETGEYKIKNGFADSVVEAEAKLAASMVNSINKLNNGKKLTIEDVNAILKGVSNKDFLELGRNTSEELTEELVFTKDGKNKTVHKSLVERINMYQNDSLNANENEAYQKAIDKGRLEMTKRLRQTPIYLTDKNGNVKKELKEMIDNFVSHSGEKDFSKNWINSRNILIPYKMIDGKVVLNPFIESYFSEWNFSSENFNNLFVGTIYAHKGGSDAAKMSARNKRMVALPATFTPYNTELLTGISYRSKTRYVSDPTSILNNILGMTHKQDITDGGTFITGLESRLKNNSLGPNSVGTGIKDIGMTMNASQGAAGLMKHASHTGTNEVMRRTAGTQYDMLELTRAMYRGERALNGNFVWNINGYEIDIDLTKSFDGSSLEDISKIGTEFKKGYYFVAQEDSENGGFKKGEVVELVSITKVPSVTQGDNVLSYDKNTYQLTYRSPSTGIESSSNKLIENLGDLWTAIGSAYSVNPDPNGAVSNESITGGRQLKFSYNDNSTLLLSEFVNRVGAIRNENDDNLQMMLQSLNNLNGESLNGTNMTYESFRLLIDDNSGLDTRIDSDGDIIFKEAGDNELWTQNNVFQPLKIMPIGMINFMSGQKVGASDVAPEDLIHRNNILSEGFDFGKTTTRENSFTGVQLNPDHETDNSHVTEMSQILSAAIFNGDTTTEALEGYNAIAAYINKKMELFTKSLRSNDIVEINKARSYIADIIIKKQGGDETTLAGAILKLAKVTNDENKQLLKELDRALMKNDADKIQEARDRLIESIERTGSFKLPFSDGSLTKTAIATIDNSFTADIIKRKFPGGANVISGLSGFVQIYNIPIHDEDGNFVSMKRMDSDAFNRWKDSYYSKGYSEEQVLNLLRQQKMVSDIKFGDTFFTKSGEVMSLTTAEAYFAFLDSGIDPNEMVTVDYTFGSQMKPMDWNWKALGRNITLMDQPQVRSAFLFTDYIDKFNSTVKAVSNVGKLKKDEASKFRIEQAQKKADESISKFNSFVSKNAGYLGLIDPILTNPVEFTPESEIPRESYLKLVAKDNLRKETRDIDNGKMSINSKIAKLLINDPELLAQYTGETFETTGDLISYFLKNNIKIDIEGLQTHSMEIGLPNIYQTTFGLPADLPPSLVTKKTFFDLEEGKRRSEITGHQFFLRKQNGRHTYVFLKGTKEANDYLPNLRESVNTVEDGGLFVTDEHGKKLYKVNDDATKAKVYVGTAGQRTATYIIVDDLAALNELKANAVGKKNYFPSLEINEDNKIFDNASYLEVVKTVNPMLFNKLIEEGVNINIKGEDGKISLMPVDVALSMSSDDMPVPELVKLVDRIKRNAEVELMNTIDANAQKKFSSFQESLKFIVARIPGQGMQSYMGAQTTFFVTSENNTAYVSPYNFWYTGADTDIDKVFALGNAINDNGEFVGWSKYFDLSSPEALDVSKGLPFPDYKEVQIGSEGHLIDESEAMLLLSFGNGTQSGSISDLKAFVNILRGVQKNKGKVNGSILKPETIQRVREMLNDYFGEEMHDAIFEKAILNKISASLFSTSTSIKNTVHAVSPIEMDKPAEAKSKSAKGKEAANATIFDPSARPLFTETNMVGKDVIGIAAVAIKAYSAMCIRYAQAQDGSLDNLPFIAHFKEYMKDADGKTTFNDKFKVIIGSINFRENPEMLDKYLSMAEKIAESKRMKIDIEAIKQELNVEDDVALVLSALLSAATDNAKELILGAINSGKDTAAMYAYAIMMNIDFGQFATLMTTNEVDMLVKYSGASMFDPYQKGRSFEKSFALLERGIPVNSYLSNDEIDKLAGFLYHNGFLTKYEKGDSASKYPGNSREAITNGVMISDIYGIIKAIESNDKITWTEYSKLIKSNKSEFHQKKESSNNESFEDVDFDQYEDFMDFDQDMDGEYPVARREKDIKPSILRYLYAVAELRGDFGVAFKYNVQGSFEAQFANPASGVIINEVKEINKKSKAVALVGRMAGINQGLKADLERTDGYFSAIRDYFNEKLRQNIDKTKNRTNLIEEANLYTTNPLEVGSHAYFEMIEFINKLALDGFDHIQFASDKYAKMVSFVFNAFKEDINPFDILASDSHFREMYKAAVDAEELNKKLFKKRRVAEVIIDKMINDKFLNPLVVDGVDTFYRAKLAKGTYQAATNLAGNFMLASYFQNKEKEVTIYDKQVIDEGGRFLTTTTPRVISLASYEGREAFVKWFETSFISDLKQGKVRNKSSESGDGYEFIEALNDNRFIVDLTKDTIKNKITGGKEFKLKLPIDMTRFTKNPDAEALFNEYSKGFKSLKNITYDGQDLIGLFYLYNLIVNKNAASGNSLTPLFSEMLATEPLLKEQLEYFGELDYSSQDDDIDSFINEAFGEYSNGRYENLEMLIAAGFAGKVSEFDIASNTYKGHNLVVVQKPGEFNKYYTFDKKSRSYNRIYDGVNEELSDKYLIHKGTISHSIPMSSQTAIKNTPQNKDYIKRKILESLVNYKIEC